MFSCSCTIYWRNCVCPIVLSSLLCEISVDTFPVDLFLGSLLCPTELYSSVLSPVRRVLVTVAWSYILKSCSISSPVLLFSNIVLVIRGLLPLQTHFIRFYFFISREMGREVETEGDKHQLVASLTPLTEGGEALALNPGMCPHWNWTGDPLLCGMMPNPLSHTS